jgi:lysine biosynthesis protein LysW
MTMLEMECVECGSKINLRSLEHGERVNCLECGIELEVNENDLISLQLGLSEE